MATGLKADCIRLTVGLVHDQQRLQYVMGFYAAAGLPAQNDLITDIDTYMDGDFYDLWKLVMAEDVSIVGWQVEGYVVESNVIPYRRNYATTEYPGTITGDSTPAQTSMLLPFYSQAEQAANPTEIVRTSKTFLGPCPESKANSGIITDGGQLAALNQLGVGMREFVGAGSAKTWTRVICPDPNDPLAVWLCDYSDERHELFTQRRRMRPLL